MRKNPLPPSSLDEVPLDPALSHPRRAGHLQLSRGAESSPGKPPPSPDAVPGPAAATSSAPSGPSSSGFPSVSSPGPFTSPSSSQPSGLPGPSTWPLPSALPGRHSGSSDYCTSPSSPSAPGASPCTQSGSSPPSFWCFHFTGSRLPAPLRPSALPLPQLSPPFWHWLWDKPWGPRPRPIP